MKLHHTGLCNANIDQARLFYAQLLGLEEKYTFHLEPDLAKQIFGLEESFTVLVFGNQNLQLEIFVASNAALRQVSPVNHLCLEVKDRHALLNKCQQAGIEIIQLERNGRPLIFIKDFFGNLFEIKEVQNEVKPKMIAKK